MKLKVDHYRVYICDLIYLEQVCVNPYISFLWIIMWFISSLLTLSDG